MPLNPDAVGASSRPVQTSWTPKDCMLYALGVGAGADDPTGSELAFTTDNSVGVTQQVLPTFAVIASWSGFAGGDALDAVGAFDKAMAVHAQQTIELHAPLPAQGAVTTTATITGIWDKGSGALLDAEAVGLDADTGKPLFTNRNSIFIKGEGGWGGERGPSVAVSFPERAPDHRVTYRTRPDQALLYRLSGDDNPLHSDPTFARRGGFCAPILHGLCTYGFSGRALLHTLCGSDPARFSTMSARFSRPVVPGDELTVSIWRLADGQAVYRTANQRDETVLDSGQFAFVEQ